MPCAAGLAAQVLDISAEVFAEGVGLTLLGHSSLKFWLLDLIGGSPARAPARWAWS